MAYLDLHQHLKNLEEHGLLRRITRLINKDTELHPLVRWQYRGLQEEERKAWLFENVTDAKGRKYDMPVVVGALAGNPAIYFLGMGCKTADEMDDRWKKALSEPLAPIAVNNAKCQDVVYLGDELDKEGCGLDRFPVPISTPGFDNGPYTTCSHWFTRDPETGIHNIGNYRGQIKARRRIGVFPSGLGQDIYLHWKKAQAKGQHLPAALVVGAPPVVSYVSVQKVAYGLDEMSVAGALVDRPIPMVRCKTVDIMVPADAEIVIEGYLNTEYIEPEGPFGESHGYMHPRQLNPFMDVTAITHRKDAIYTSWLSQLTPSESSVIRKIGYDRLMLVHLRDECRITSVLRVEMHEPLTNTYKLVIIQMRRPNEAEVWRALHAACSFHPGVGKIVVAVDEDIDPSNEAGSLLGHVLSHETAQGRAHCRRYGKRACATVPLSS